MEDFASMTGFVNFFFHPVEALAFYVAASLSLQNFIFIRHRPKYRLSALTEALHCVGPIAGEIADRGSGTDMYIEQFSGDILLNQDRCSESRLHL